MVPKGRLDSKLLICALRRALVYFISALSAVDELICFQIKILETITSIVET